MTKANANQDVCDVCDQEPQPAWRNAAQLLKFSGTDFPDGLQAAVGSLGVACGSCKKEE